MVKAVQTARRFRPKALTSSIARTMMAPAFFMEVTGTSKLQKHQQKHSSRIVRSRFP